MAAALAVVAMTGCHKDTIVTTRTVTTHVPAACALDGNGYATYLGLGDFEAAAVQPGPFLKDEGTVLPQLDGQTRELVVTASENGGQWAGLGPVGTTGDVDVLMLPQKQSCKLTTSVGPRTGSTMAPIGSRFVLLAGGQGNPIPSSYVESLDTGVVTALPSGSELPTPRTGATVTAFGEGGLVAGGVPLAGGAPLATAEVYSPSAAGFTTSIPLDEARAQHAAVVLPDGETLLIGGVGADGKTPLPRMEIVDPSRDRAHESSVALLNPVLANPVAIRLTTGQVLVAGGTATPSGVPATGLERFALAVSTEGQTGISTVGSTQFIAPGRVTMAALPAGGALVVVAGTSSQDTWVIDSAGVPIAAAPSGAVLNDPKLFDGAGGAPVLWTGAAWLRWQPWLATFTTLSTSDTAAPSVGDATCSPDSGLAMWLDPTTRQLTTLRFDTRNAYSSLQGGGPLDFATDTAPDGIASAGGVTYDDLTKQLTLVSSTAAVFVTDRTYADVSIEMSLPTSQPPVVVLRDEMGNEFTTASCAGLAQQASHTSRLDIERTGGTVTFSLDGGAATPCSPPPARDARVSIGLRAGSSRAVVGGMFVTRLGSP